MDGKFLGKITEVRFGPNAYSVLDDLTLFLTLAFNGGVADWSSIDLNLIRDTMLDAQVDDVTKLVGKPVEVTIEKNEITAWRILTEVI